MFGLICDLTNLALWVIGFFIEVSGGENKQRRWTCSEVGQQRQREYQARKRK